MNAETLYQQTLERLEELCKEKGIQPGPRPYFIEEFKTTKGNADYSFAFEDFKGFFMKEEDQKDANDSCIIYNVSTFHGPFRRFVSKENAEKDCLILNKRNRICMLMSDNPKFPVYI